MKQNKMNNVYKAIMLILLTATITFIITSTVMYKNYKEIPTIKYVATDSVGRTFQTFKNYINEKYLYDIDENKMLESAIKGYVAGLGDDYSEYITKEEMTEYMEDTIGKYVGIGVYLIKDTESNKVCILGTMKGSPAAEAGIKSGDLINKVDDVEYTAEQLSEASAALRKEEGTIAKVEILRNDEIMTFDVERKKIKTNHIVSKVLENNIGYIEINSFDEGTYDEFVQNYEELKQKNIKALIIDLRNNGGGIVQEALNVADMMTEKDKTLLIMTEKKDNENITKATKDKEINLPVVVLINEGTASSSEILASAVKENNDNVKLIGTTTYGKGVIQTIFTLSDGSGLKLTTNEYFTPNRNSINKVGIKPDIEVKLPEGKNIYNIEEKEDTQLQKAIEVLK